MSKLVDEFGDDVNVDFMDKWPSVSVPVHNALTQIVESIQVLEENHPIVTSYAESFIEILMNIFPSNGKGFKVNPAPIVDMVVLDENNVEVFREPSGGGKVH